MKKRNFTGILIHFYITWICVQLIDQAFGITICNEDFDRATTISLGVNLSNLYNYEGNCTCTILAVNQDTKVTLSSSITACPPISLKVDHWDYAAQCTAQQYTMERSVIRGKEYDIFLNASTHGYAIDAVGGTIQLTADASISVRCHEAIYYIPPTTTPAPTTTPTTTTTTEIPIPETVVASAATVFGGFVILMLLVSWGIWCRERRKREHDAYLANLNKTIPDIERDRIDPEMTKYSWFKTLTVRLKRFYFGEARRSKPGRGARGRSQAREGPTGTHARRRFQSLFRKKSESVSSGSARDHSPIEDDDLDSSPDRDAPGSQGTDDVFPEVSAHHGGGIFMDARRPSQEDLSAVPADEDGDGEAVVVVHTESPRTTSESNEADRELVSSLFGGFDDEVDSRREITGQGGGDAYAVVDAENGSAESESGEMIKNDQMKKDFDQTLAGPNLSHLNLSKGYENVEVDENRNNSEESLGGSNKPDIVSQISKMSNGHAPEANGELYASINKEKKGGLFRI